MDMKKVHDKVNMEALWQVVRKNGVDDKLPSGTESMNVNNLLTKRKGR